MGKLEVIAFDADDTLWVNEPIFIKTRERLESFISPYVDINKLEKKVYETEIKNLRLFGYGIKGFMLSMIESVIELTDGRITGNEIQQAIDLGKEMLEHPVELMPGIEQVLETLKDDYRIMMITKGDLFDQESKIARSGLAEHFEIIEIVSEKNEETYLKVLKRNKIDPSNFLMIGNSPKSDILPICKIGGRAIHIPFHTTWEHELISHHEKNGIEYEELPDVSLVPEFIKKLEQH
ncbi:MAG: HAD family hydrolase [bacterium]|nr:HAD family hydrolase [bacterium]